MHSTLAVFRAIALLALACAFEVTAATHPAPAAATSAAPGEPAAKAIPGGGPKLRARVESTATIDAPQGSYRILLSVPDGEPPTGGFPVLYVLDADAWFDAAVAIVRMREYSKLAPTVVVGVGSPSGAFFDLSRTYDFTPAGASDPSFGDIPTGGASEFRAFVGDTLKPWVRAKVRVDETREILFGHSLGGLFALDTLLAAPGMFDVYLAASPSIRLFDRAIVKSAAKCGKRARSSAPRVLVTVGGLESHPSPALVEDYRRWYTAHPDALGGAPVEDLLADIFKDDPGFDKTAETRALAARLGQCGFDATFAEFADEEHTAAAISALNRGVPFALRGR